MIKNLFLIPTCNVTMETQSLLKGLCISLKEILHLCTCTFACIMILYIYTLYIDFVCMHVFETHTQFFSIDVCAIGTEYERKEEIIYETSHCTFIIYYKQQILEFTRARAHTCTHTHIHRHMHISHIKSGLYTHTLYNYSRKENNGMKEKTPLIIQKRLTSA